MSTVENITPVTEEKNNLKEVVEKKTVNETVDNDEPETKKQRLSDLNDDIKDSDDKAPNGDEADEDDKEADDEAEEKEDDEEIEATDKGKEKDCNGSSAKVTENGDSAQTEVKA